MARCCTGELSRRGLLMMVGAGLLAAPMARPDRDERVRLMSQDDPMPPAAPSGAGATASSGVTPTVVSPPTILSCDGWGARDPSGKLTVLSSRPSKILVHHTATANADEVSQDDLIVLAQSIQKWHMDHNGWVDTGQHFTVNRGGLVAEGRHHSLETLAGGVGFVEGDQCFNQNDVSIGIENQGTYTDDDPPDALLGSLTALLAYCAAQYRLTPAQIYGHRDFNDTACPGDKLYAMLPALRRQVGQLLGAPIDQAAASPPVWPLLRAGSTGPAVVAAQHLLRGAGQTGIGVDGAFDAGTVSAVMSFQGSRGLAPTGMLGGGSWPLLAVPVGAGTSGEAADAVRVLRAHSHTGAGSDAEGAADATGAVTTGVAWQRLLDAAAS